MLPTCTSIFQMCFFVCLTTALTINLLHAHLLQTVLISDRSTEQSYLTTPTKLMLSKNKVFRCTET